MKSIVFALSLVLFIACADTSSNSSPELPPLLPLPQSVEQQPGNYAIASSISYSGEEEFPVASGFLKNYLENAGLSVSEKPNGASKITFLKDTALSNEGYRLQIDKNGITLKASEDAGAFYRVQTLRELLPASLEKGSASEHF